MNELLYEPLSLHHAKELLNLWSEYEVIKYTNMTLPCTMDDVKHRIEIFKPMDVFVVKQNGELIGIVGCPTIDKDAKRFGLFYQVSQSDCGKGNATMATKWLLEYMKETYGEATIFADVLEQNKYSERILQKLGFKRITQKSIERSGEQRILCEYELELS